MSETFNPDIHVADKDGNPKLTQNGNFRRKRGAGPANGRPGGSRRPSGSTSASSRPSRAESQHRRYSEGVMGLLQIPAAALSFVDPVDGYCVAQHSPGIADAVASVAVERPEVAAALDKILAVGPYGALIGAVLPLAVQLMHNHDKIPEPIARSMGATPRRDIERHLKVVGDEMAEQEQREAQDWAREHPEPGDPFDVAA